MPLVFIKESCRQLLQTKIEVNLTPFALRLRIGFDRLSTNLLLSSIIISRDQVCSDACGLLHSKRSLKVRQLNRARIDENPKANQRKVDASTIKDPHAWESPKT